MPTPRSLVRASVPVFGLAYGDGFAEYRLEYGVGAPPVQWTLITQSKTEQVGPVSPIDLMNTSASVTLRGNLGNWDTGLKSYVYPPDYPPDHSVDLNGVYTLRLVVRGRNNEEAEDRVLVQVGEAIANAWGGTVSSPDGLARLTIQEHSLTSALRVLAIRALDANEPSLPRDPRLRGAKYEFRQAGERFLEPAILDLHARGTPRNVRRGDFGVCALDSDARVWRELRSTVTEAGDIRAEVDRLAPYYSVCVASPSTKGVEVLQVALPSRATSTGDDLVNDTFEEGMGDWTARRGQSATTLTLDRTSRADCSGSLRLTSADPAGGIYALMRSTPFDATEFPVVSFEYRIPPGLKVNLFAKVKGRWYEVGLTGGTKEFRYKSVNITPAGQVGGITADDRWHTVEIDLLEMLRTATGNSEVDRLILADLDVSGYMKLEQGSPTGASMFVDNVVITRRKDTSRRTAARTLIVDDFNGGATNNSGQNAWHFSDSAISVLDVDRAAHLNTSDELGTDALDLHYDLERSGSFVGYFTGLPNLDITPYRAMAFSVAGVPPTDRIVVGLRDSGGREVKVPLVQDAAGDRGPGWHHVEIPLAAFNGVRSTSIAGISVAVEHAPGSGRGHLLLGDIALRTESSSILLHDFKNGGDTNRLGGQSSTLVRGAATLDAGVGKPEPGALRLSFGGGVGQWFADSAGDGLSYSQWATDLKGMNVDQCQGLSFRIKGQAGEEPVRVYLDDGAFRWGVDIPHHTPFSEFWQPVFIPLADFSRYGVDLTHVSSLQFVFEWKPMAGTIYLDDLTIVCGQVGSSVTSSLQ